MNGFLENLFANTHATLGAMLSIDNIVEILLGILIGVIAFYQRKVNLFRAKKLQEATAIHHDVKNAVTSLRAELDAMKIIQHKELSLENKEVEYQATVQKLEIILEKLERYGLKDIEKML